MQTASKKHHELYEAIAAIVGTKYVIDDEFELIPYARDISYFPGVMPGIVVRPKTTEEVSAIVKLANRTGYPIVVKGGGQAGGGVTPGEARRNIMIDMGRMDEITVKIDDLKVVAGAGARLSTIDDALRPYGYYVNTVIGPYYTATVGGLFSGIAGAGFGKNVSSAGCNWTFVLGLKVVLPNGDIITTGAGPSSNNNREEILFREVTGPDLTDLFISSGGAFGLITEATIRAIRIPAHMKAISYIVPTMEETWEIAKDFTAMDRVPYSNTIMFRMDNYMVKAIADGAEGFGAYFFACEGDDPEDVERRIQVISEVCERHGAVHGNPKMDHYAMTGTTGTMEMVHDVCANSCPFMTWESMFSRSRSLEYTKGLIAAFDAIPGHREMATGAGLYMVPMGHIFLTGVTLRSALQTPEAEEHLRKTWEAGAKFMREIGTSSTYAQGTNSNYIAETWSPAYVRLMSAIKHTLDPNNIMCPGLWNL